MIPPHLRRLSSGAVSRLRRDAMAGLTGAVIVVPQGVAFAAIAGMPPAYGFYTAMVPVLVAALAGSSRLAVSGPNTAICLMVFAALFTHFPVGSQGYIDAAVLLALIVGVLQIGFALARMGALIDFISHSVMVGFVTAAAIQILVSQVPQALGLTMARTPDLPGTLVAILTALPSAQPASIGLTCLTIMVALMCRWAAPKWPAYLVALLASSVLAPLFGPLPEVGAVSNVFPTLRLAMPDPALVRELAPAALAIAIVGLLQSSSIGRSLAHRTGQPFDSNREFLGQGLSNVAGALFQCFPAAASFTRSGVNLEAGAQSRLAAVFATLMLAAILTVVGPLFAHVPMAAIAGIILLVAVRLIDIAELRQILRASRAETAITATTFLMALLVNLEFAILAGVLMSLAVFLRNTARPHIGIGAPDPSTGGRIFRDAAEHGLAECPQLVVARINGPLYFGSVEFIRRAFRRIALDRPGQRHMLFIVKGVGEIDLPGAELLLEEAEARAARGGAFHLQTRTPRQLEKVARLHVLRNLTRSNIHLSKGAAIEAIVPTLDPDICRTCTSRIFRECGQRPGGQAS